MNQEIRVQILLAAQRALLGQVPQSLRAVSVDVREECVYVRSIFDGKPTEEDRELLSCVGAEIIADFVALFTTEEDFLALPFPEEMNHLQLLVYLRHEPQIH